MASYGEIKRAVLELINQSTMAGEAVALSYNNQMDYILRIPNLINQAVMKIRTTRNPIRRTAELTEGTRRGGCILYPLPSDCRSLVTGGVWKVDNRHSERTNEYKLMGNSIMLPAPTLRSAEPDAVVGWDVEVRDGGYFIEYFAFPAQLPADPADGFSLDETPDVIQAAEYYAAAQLVMMEDEYISANLMNEYEDRLAAMVPPVTAEITKVRDVFSMM